MRMRSATWIAESMRMAIILEPNPATSAEMDTASGVTNRTVP
jgi:hypothetical protein